MWTLDEGLRLVRAIQSGCRRFGYHLALGGGVLNKGQSDKDVDLYFLPLNNDKYKEDKQGLLVWLESLWGQSQVLGDYGQAVPQFKYELKYDLEGNMIGVEAVPILAVEAPKQPKDGVYKYKLKFVRAGGDRIDAFIL